LLTGMGAASGCASSGTFEHPSAFPGAPSRAAVASEAGAILAVRRAVVEAALELKGAPYRLGGMQPPSGFDCSGLVHYVFQQQRIALPRTVAEQAHAGRKVDRKKVQAGDLLFFSIGSDDATHVGIVIDDQQFVHAPGVGRVVRAERYTTPYWQAHFKAARRVADTPPLAD
jgi:cell wall-associated NlpC family hydrolase